MEEFVMEILAHRGIHEKAMENSLESFEFAVSAPVDGVELDIRLTADNEVVVFHDEDLKRLFENDGKISSLTYEEINEISFAEGVRVPKLKEIFDLLLNDRIINVEIKETQVVKPLAELLKNSEVKLDKLIFSSFIHDSLLELRRLVADAKIGLLIGEESRQGSNPLEYINNVMQKYMPYSLHLPVDAFSVIPPDLLLPQLKLLKEKTGVKYAWWTINKKEQVEILVKNELITDYIISDDTQMVSAILNSEN
jgi:glycerophosphoryl diester phosphodiesterase